ncbi:STAS domain-containing protein [Eleftheria terrae]|uniref:STAS domain-containing protein n=1 Tax=Eleftheria terrae TaxID=1597781 RepID=UPI00263B7D94|nr:STAS domain-containing protein [Eleftheria terrae]WKB50744.1 STAS domain-containing protein [Eleftheria terrae]
MNADSSPVSALASTSTTPAALRVEGELTIYRAAALKQHLLGWSHEAPVVELDLAEVTEIDTAGIQLLLALKRKVVAMERELRLVAHSQVVREALRTVGMAAMFGIGVSEAV